MEWWLGSGGSDGMGGDGGWVGVELEAGHRERVVTHFEDAWGLAKV